MLALLAHPPIMVWLANLLEHALPGLQVTRNAGYTRGISSSRRGASAQHPRISILLCCLVRRASLRSRLGPGLRFRARLAVPTTEIKPRQASRMLLSSQIVVCISAKLVSNQMKLYRVRTYDCTRGGGFLDLLSDMLPPNKLSLSEEGFEASTERLRR